MSVNLFLYSKLYIYFRGTDCFILYSNELTQKTDQMLIELKMSPACENCSS